jgi:hypothetical protein
MNFIAAYNQKERIMKRILIMEKGQCIGFNDANFISSYIKPGTDDVEPIVVYNVKNAAEFKSKYDIIETDYVSIIDSNYDIFTTAQIEGRLILRED